jgi:hypothetical protein
LAGFVSAWFIVHRNGGIILVRVVGVKDTTYIPPEVDREEPMILPTVRVRGNHGDHMTQMS